MSFKGFKLNERKLVNQSFGNYEGRSEFEVTVYQKNNNKVAVKHGFYYYVMLN